MTNTHHESTQDHDALFRVRTDGVVDWLATASDSQGGRFADTDGLAGHDTFRRGAHGIHDRIQMLVDQAQSDGILHSPGYDIMLWQVADEGFLLTLDAAAPPRLCSLHLGVDDLVPDNTSGSVAALAVLMAVAHVANQILTEHRRTRAAAIGSAAFSSIRQGTPVDPSSHTTGPTTIARVHITDVDPPWRRRTRT
jgi:hypothetical protein